MLSRSLSTALLAAGLVLLPAAAAALDFFVNSTDDGLDAHPGDGDCFTGRVIPGAHGHCDHCLIAENSGAANCSTPVTSGGHNLEDRDDCGFRAAGDLVNTDPLLLELHDNGGPTLTHAFALTSPAMNAGAPRSVPTTDRDQRGVRRPQFGATDIGAFEAGPVLGIDADVPIPIRFGCGGSGCQPERWP